MFALQDKFKDVGSDNLFISEITLAELKYGVANSANPEKNSSTLTTFLSEVEVIPIFDALDTYASEKTRLKRSGTIIDEFDLLIGATAITHNLTLVTNNTKHFSRLNGILLENWVST